MTTTYYIKGMTCNGCVNSVTELVGALPGTSNVVVDLDSTRLTFDSENEMAFETIATAVSSTGHYTLLKEKFVVKKVSPIKKFIPLMVMFAIILLWTAGFAIHRGVFDFHRAMYDFMSGFFLAFGIMKLFNLKGFAASYKNYDFLASVSTPYAYAYPFIEVILGLAYLFLFALPVVNSITFILMGLKAYSVREAVNEGRNIQCACLGGFFSIPITRFTFFEDSLMAIMALTMLIFPIQF